MANSDVMSIRAYDCIIHSCIQVSIHLFTFYLVDHIAKNSLSFVPFTSSTLHIAQLHEGMGKKRQQQRHRLKIEQLKAQHGKAWRKARALGVKGGGAGLTKRRQGGEAGGVPAPMLIMNPWV